MKKWNLLVEREGEINKILKVYRREKRKKKDSKALTLLE